MEDRTSGIRCHKCRSNLAVLYTSIIDAHKGTGRNPDCENIIDNSHIFLAEDSLPTWIRDKVEEEGWVKGKLHCSHCGGKIGSFDFVSGQKCGCGEQVLPPVHLIRSQVDITVNVTRS